MNINRPQTKIEELESIRGIAALLVVLYHIPLYNQILDIGVIRKGTLMVDLFFVLSGFVICNAYADKIRSTKDLLRFQFLRFGRLYPIHILFLMAFVLIELAKYVAASKLGISSPNNTTPFKENSLDALIQNIFLIQSILPNQELTFNYPAWSISVEFYTYLVFALGVLLLNKVKILFFGLFAIVSFALMVTDLSYGFGSLLKCFTGFFIGCLTVQVHHKMKASLPMWSPLICLLIIFLFLQMRLPSIYNPLIYIFTTFLILSLTNSPPGGGTKKMLNLKMLTWLGTISYSVYMSHASVLWVINQLVRIFLKRPEIIDIHGKSIIQLSVSETLIVVSVATASVLIVSSIAYNLVEKPMREKSRLFAFSRLT